MPAPLKPVIVVDDDAAVRHSLKFALELEGFQVSDYAGGADLLAQANLPADACLVVDFYMPGMDGLELVRRLGRRDVKLPTILITAKAAPELSARARQAGIWCVLEKPLQDASLVNSIHDALSSRGHRMAPEHP